MQCYGLSSRTQIDHREISELTESIVKATVTQEQLARIAFFYDRLRDGRPGWFEKWEWFCRCEQTLQTSTRTMGEFLAARAIDSGDARTALEIAHTLLKLDPLDEDACTTAIKAHLSTHNQTGAETEYRAYAKVLKGELNAEPSLELRGLLNRLPSGDQTVTAVR